MNFGIRGGSIVGLGLLVLACLLQGCASTPATRINEKPAAFRLASPEQRAMIRRGQIEEGFTVDQVYLALGQPTAVRRDPGGGEKWTYRNYFPSEHVAADSLYAKPSSSGGASSGSVAGALGGVGSVSGGSVSGGYTDVSSPGAGSGAEVSGALLEIWFAGGRVTSIRLTP